ncbi:MAG: DUF1854 domain-containing protein [Clostridia bacterium]|nr:DUF1854 domain-containing protein [Clostridia bacterium]
MRGMKRGQHAGEEKKMRTLAELSVTVWLTPENATFFIKNNFLYVRQNGEETRAFLCRQFPFELQWEFISVLNEDQEELGIIRDVALFEGETREILTEELRRRYYAPVIERIHSVKERYGFSYWRVQTPEGDVSFTLHDTYRSIIHAGENRLILLDVNGNRFEIPDASVLDRKSYKRIELYL